MEPPYEGHTWWCALRRCRHGSRTLPSGGAGVAELADAPDLGSGAARHGGSSPPSRIPNSDWEFASAQRRGRPPPSEWVTAGPRLLDSGTRTPTDSLRQALGGFHVRPDPFHPIPGRVSGVPCCSRRAAARGDCAPTTHRSRRGEAACAAARWSIEGGLPVSGRRYGTP